MDINENEGFIGGLFSLIGLLISLGLSIIGLGIFVALVIKVVEFLI